MPNILHGIYVKQTQVIANTWMKTVYIAREEKNRKTHSRRIRAASLHSATRLLYPGLVVKACFKPERASNILAAFGCSLFL